MEQTDLIQTSSANTEIFALTNKLEESPTRPTQNVSTLSERLDSLLTNIEEGEANKQTKEFHSFTNQPERVNISSDSDISITQAQFGIEEQTYNNFRVAIKRPFLDVKSIQLLRASIPNAVTNIPDDQTTFWYYRLPLCYAGLISLTIPGVSGYSNASYSTTGVITPAVSTATLISITPSFPAVGVATYFITSLTGLANGSSVTISGVTPAGYNGTFIISDISIPNVSFRVVNATTGAANVASATLTQTITDTIDFNLGTINNASGGFLGNYNVADAAFGSFSATIFNYSGGSIGTILVLSASIILQQPSTSNLYMNRLLPSYYKEELFDYSTYKQAQNPYTTYGLNRTFGDYQSVLTELQKCSLRDPAYDTNNGGTDLSGAILMRNLYIPGDVTFSFNEQINKFRMNGNNAFVTNSSSISILVRRYLIAGYTDPNIPIKAEQLKVLTAGISGITASLDFPSVPGASMGGMPYLLYKTLNMRLGFVWDGINAPVIVIPNNLTNSVTRSLLNRLRPLIFDAVLSVDPPNPALVGVTSPQFTTIYTADTYADLVYTNSVSLYADFTGGSSYDSVGNTQLLACVPMNASNLGVTFYNTTLYCPLTKISDQIYEIEIRMLTDTGAPYNVPNSAIVSLELALTY